MATTNQELYTTAKSRRVAFNEFCRKHKCDTCPAFNRVYFECRFNWLEMPADVQLKPCPFCGCEPEVVEIKDWAEIKCSICDMVVQGDSDVLSAAAKWNHRGAYLNPRG